MKLFDVFKRKKDPELMDEDGFVLGEYICKGASAKVISVERVKEIEMQYLKKKEVTPEIIE